jgi:outer membrane protein OmpA-like peptidoglycan-associated protein
MRKIVLSLIVLSLCVASKAQFSVALVGGPQVNSITPGFTLLPDTVTKTVSRYTGINIGFIGDVALNKKQSLFFRTGALFSAKGSQIIQHFDTSKVDLTTGQYLLQATSSLKINYIDIPVDFVLKLPLKGKTKFLLGAGVQASLFYNGSTTLSTINVSKQDAYSPPETEYKQTVNNDLPVGNADNKYRVVHFSANALTGFEFGRVFLTANYSNGLTDFFKSNEQSFKHQTIGVHLGIFVGSTKVKTQIADRNKNVYGVTNKIADRDKDGIPDKEDQCPDQPGPASNKGCPILDRDGDGVLDVDDKCPDVPGVKKYNGCPIPDTDGDGVNDEEDQCPTVAGSKDNHGCPKITEEQKKKIAYAAKRIQFEFKSTDILPSSYAVLDEVVEILKSNPTLNIRVEGHTSGPVKESNTILSQKRADSVKDYFVSKGIAANRIEAKGFGSSKHISKDGDQTENPIDRRVELIIF